MELESDYQYLVLTYFSKLDNIGVMNCDWNRFDFSKITLKVLNECLGKIKVGVNFNTSTNQKLIYRYAVLKHAIESEITRRPIEERYPEIWLPLIRANERLDRMEERYGEFWLPLIRANEILTSSQERLYGSQHLAAAFTKIALKYLKEKNNLNNNIDAFEECDIALQCSNPDFKLDGLIYNSTDNVLHMIKAKDVLDKNELLDALTTKQSLMNFLLTDKPNGKGKERNRWNSFFDEEDGLIKDKSSTKVEVFLGFHSITDRNLIEEAQKKGVIVIGPERYHYKVYT